jgi:hypothetical protein
VVERYFVDNKVGDALQHRDDRHRVIVELNGLQSDEVWLEREADPLLGSGSSELGLDLCPQIGDFWLQIDDGFLLKLALDRALEDRGDRRPQRVVRDGRERDIGEADNLICRIELRGAEKVDDPLSVEELMVRLRREMPRANCPLEGYTWTSSTVRVTCPVGRSAANVRPFR